MESESVTEGQILDIRTRAGKTWQARVTKVVWSGQGVSLCATEQIRGQAAAAAPAKAAHSGRCRECRGAIEHAPHHRAVGGLCGSCAFDEYDGC